MGKMSESESTNATEETTPEETPVETSSPKRERRPLRGKPGVPRNLRARSRKYAKRIGKRGTNEVEEEEETKSPLSTAMIAFLVFVVAGSSLFQIISSLMDPSKRTD